MDQIRARLNPALKLGGVVACRVNRTMHARAVVARLQHRYPEAFLETQIRESIRLAEASSFRLPITAYAPTSAGAEDYRALAAEIFEPANAPSRVTRRIVVADPGDLAAAPIVPDSPTATGPMARLRQVLGRATHGPSAPDPVAHGTMAESGGGPSTPER
jgi:hypothetical protein